MRTHPTKLRVKSSLKDKKKKKKYNKTSKGPLGRTPFHFNIVPLVNKKGRPRWADVYIHTCWAANLCCFSWASNWALTSSAFFSALTLVGSAACDFSLSTLWSQKVKKSLKVYEWTNKLWQTGTCWALVKIQIRKGVNGHRKYHPNLLLSL